MILRTAWRRSLFLLAVVLLGVQGYAGEGKDAPDAAKPPAPASDLETVAVVSDQAPVKADGKLVATVEKGRMFGVLARRGDLVEIQVCVGTQILRGTLQVSHVKFLTEADVDLAAEWLKMSKVLNPKLDVAACRAKLDALVERVAAATADGKTPREKARLIGVQLFQREGLIYEEGLNRPDRLLDLKQGDCSGFSFLYLCIGQRLRMPLCLVAAPDHAFVRYEGRGERFNIETTREGKLHDTDGYLREHLGAQRFSQVGGSHLASLPVPSALGPLLFVWGKAHDDMGNSAKACEKYAKAVEISPRYAEAYRGWGAALAKMGRPAQACEKYAKAVEINPREAEAYINWGAALGEMGKPAEACEKLAKAVEVNPRYAAAYYNWGFSLGNMGKAAEAIEKLDRAAALDPSLKGRVDGLRRLLTGGK